MNEIEKEGIEAEAEAEVAQEEEDLALETVDAIEAEKDREAVLDQEVDLDPTVEEGIERVCQDHLALGVEEEVNQVEINHPKDM